MTHQFTHIRAYCLISVAAFMLWSPAISFCASTTDPTTSPTPGDLKASRGLTIAILDFEANTPASPDLGKEISEILLARLSEESGLAVVDRAALTKILLEHELNLTGLVDQAQAIKVGKLAGAKLLVAGKAFVLDKQIYITAKIIGTETSLVDGVVVKGSVDGDMGPLVVELSDKLIKHLREVGPRLMPADDADPDPLPALKARLAGRKLPKLGIRIVENHLADGATVDHPAATAPRTDPAVETELKKVLLQCGFTIVDEDESRWTADGVDVGITGEAFSEFGARIGTLVSCSARVELNAKDRKSGVEIFSDRSTARAADLAEITAGKTALQHAARELAIRLVERLSD